MVPFQLLFQLFINGNFNTAKLVAKRIKRELHIKRKSDAFQGYSLIYTHRHCPNEGQSGNETALSVDSSLCSSKNILKVPRTILCSIPKQRTGGRAEADKSKEKCSSEVLGTPGKILSLNDPYILTARRSCYNKLYSKVKEIYRR